MTTFIVKNTDPSANPDLVETVTLDHFGVNFLVNQLPSGDDPLDKSLLVAALKTLGANNLRWPGGTVTETVFNLNNENALVMNGDPVMPQHDFMTIAGQLGADVTLTLHTRSAFGADHSAALALADGTYGNRTVDAGYIADLKAYVLRSLQDAAANGTQIRLFEIGNEFWGGGEMTATEYGRVCRAVLQALDEVLDTWLPPGIARPGISIQSEYAAGYMSPALTSAVYVSPDGLVDNQFHAGWTPYLIPGQGTSYVQVLKIADEITGLAEGGPNLSGLVTGVIDHYYPKLGLSTVDGETEGFIFRQMTNLEKRLGFAYGALERNMTEWNPIRYVDMNNDGVNDNGAANRGMPQASEMLDIMYELTTHGVHSANVWPLYFAKAAYTNLIEGGTFDIRVPGAAFQLMRESLVGTEPIFDFMEQRLNLEIDVHGYTDAHRLVMLFTNQSDAVCPDTVLNLGTAGSATLQAQLSGSYFITTTRLNAVDANGNPDPGITTADVTPVYSWLNGHMGTGKVLGFGDMAAWDIMRTEVTFITDAPDLVQGRGGNDAMNGLGGADTLLGDAGNDTLSGGKGSDSLLGGADNDRLYGQAGNDLLYGEAGNDRLQGDIGTDRLFGGAGNDTLIGSGGPDQLTGGDGADVFLFGNAFGRDRILDFSQAEGDRISLVGLTKENDVTSFAQIKAHMHADGTGTHITFGTWDILVDHMAPADFTAADFIW